MKEEPDKLDERLRKLQRHANRKHTDSLFGSPVNNVHPLAYEEADNEAEKFRSSRFSRFAQEDIKKRLLENKMARDRQRRGLDLTEFDAHHDIDNSGIHVRPRSEEGILKVPGNKYELLRKPFKDSVPRSKRRGGARKHRKNKYKQILFDDSDEQSDNTIDDSPTEDHDILGFKTVREEKKKQFAVKNKHRQSREDDEEDGVFKENEDEDLNRQERALKLNIIDDRNVITEVRRNDKAHSITLTLKKGEGESKHSERAVNENDAPNRNEEDDVNRERQEWFDKERRMMQKEIESALKVNHKPITNQNKDSENLMVTNTPIEMNNNNDMILKNVQLQQDMHETQKNLAKSAALASSKRIDEQNGNPSGDTVSSPKVTETTENSTETAKNLQLLKNSNSNVPSVVDDMMRNQDTKDLDNKDFKNFEIEAARNGKGSAQIAEPTSDDNSINFVRNLKGNVQIIGARNEENQTEHVNTLEEVSSPTSAVEQQALSTKNKPRVSTLSYGASTEVWVISDKLNKLDPNNEHFNQDGLFRVKESEDMVHAKDKDAILAAKNAEENEKDTKYTLFLPEFNNEPAIQDAVLELDKIDVDEMPKDSEQKFKNSQNNANRVIRKDKYSLMDYYDTESQLQGKETHLSQPIEDENYKLYERGPDMDAGGEYDDYGGDSHKRKRDINVFYEELHHNTGRKLMHIREDLSSNNEEPEYRYLDPYVDHKTKKSEGDDEEEEGDPYISRKLKYNNITKLNLNTLSSKYVPAKSADEFNAEQTPSDDYEVNSDADNETVNVENKNNEKKDTETVEKKPAEPFQESNLNNTNFNNMDNSNSTGNFNNTGSFNNTNDSNTNTTTEMPECPSTENNNSTMMAGQFEINTESETKTEKHVTMGKDEDEVKEQNATAVANTTSVTETAENSNANSRYNENNKIVIDNDNGASETVLNANLENENAVDVVNGPNLRNAASFSHHSAHHAHLRKNIHSSVSNSNNYTTKFHKKHVVQDSRPKISMIDVREGSFELLSPGFKKADKYDANFESMEKRTNKNVRNLKDRHHGDRSQEPLFESQPNSKRVIRHHGHRRHSYNINNLSPFNDYQNEYMVYPRSRRYVRYFDPYVRRIRSWSAPNQKKKTVVNDNYASSSHTGRSPGPEPVAKHTQLLSSDTNKLAFKKEALKEWASAGVNHEKVGQNISKCLFMPEKGLNPSIGEKKTNEGGVSMSQNSFASR